MASVLSLSIYDRFYIFSFIKTLSVTMAANRIDEGIDLCKEILQGCEDNRPNLMGSLYQNNG